MKVLKLVFGAIVPSLQEQLLEQSITLPVEDVKHWQRDLDAIVRLSVRGFLPDSQRLKLNQKLMNRITKAVNAQ